MNITGNGGKGSARRKGANDQAYKDNYDAIFKKCEGCEQDDIQCPTCKLQGLESHSCPYKEDINGDYDTKCNCCSDCRHQCAMDI